MHERGRVPAIELRTSLERLAQLSGGDRQFIPQDTEEMLRGRCNAELPVGAIG